MWVPQSDHGHVLSWKKADDLDLLPYTEHFKDKLIRAIMINVPDILFEPSVAQLSVAEVPGWPRILLGAISDPAEDRICYGAFVLVQEEGNRLDVGNNFFPFGDGTVADATALVDFILCEGTTASADPEPGTGSAEGVSDVQPKALKVPSFTDSFRSYLAQASELVVQPKGIIRPYLPTATWNQLGSKELEVREALKRFILEPTGIKLWIAPLPFYRSYQLLEVLERRDHQGTPMYVRHYALLRSSAEVPELVVLHRNQDLLNYPNAKAGELLLNEGCLQDYLRFFFFAKQGKHGFFQLFNDHGSMSITGVRGLVGSSDVLVSGPVALKTAVEVEWNEPFEYSYQMVFKDALFSATCTIEPDGGAVSLKDEKLIVEGIPTYSESNPGPYLEPLVLRATARRPLRHWSRPGDDKAPRTAHQVPVSAAELLEGLKSNGIAANIMVQEPVAIACWQQGATQLELTSAIKLVDCIFEEQVVLGDKTHGPELIFIDCLFKKGFTARDCGLNASLTFIGCDIRSTAASGATYSAKGSAIDLRNLHVDGDLTFFDCYITRCIQATGMVVEGSLSFQACSLTFDPIQEHVPFSRIGQVGFGAHYKDGDPNVHLEAQVTNRFDIKLLILDDCRVNGSFNMTCAGDMVEAVARSEDYLRSTENVRGIMGTTILGGVQSRNLQVGGGVDLAGTVCFGEFDLSSSSFGGELKGCLRLREGFTGVSGSQAHFRVLGNLDLRATRIGGSLDIRNTDVVGSLVCDGAFVKGDVLLNGLFVRGTAQLCYMVVEGSVGDNVPTTYSERAPLYVSDDLRMWGSSFGWTWLLGATIRGSMSASASSFKGLYLETMFIRDRYGVFDIHPTRVGRLEMPSVRIELTMACSGLCVGKSAMVRKEQSSSAVDLRYARIGGSLRFPFLVKDVVDLTGYESWGKEYQVVDKLKKSTSVNGAYASIIHGHVDVSHARIEGKLDLANTRIQGRISATALSVGAEAIFGAFHDAEDPSSFVTTVFNGLELEDARITGRIEMKNVHCKGSMRLTGMTATGGLAFHACRIEGEFDAQDCTVHGPIEVIRHAPFPALEVTEDLNLSGATVNDAYWGNIKVHGAFIVVTGSFRACSLAHDNHGTAYTSGAHLGSLSFTSVRFGTHLHLGGIKVHEGLPRQERAWSTQPDLPAVVTVRNCTIEGDVSFFLPDHGPLDHSMSSGRGEGKQGQATGKQHGCEAIAQGCTHVFGTMDLSGSRVAGSLDLRNVDLRCDEKDTGSILLSDTFVGKDVKIGDVWTDAVLVNSLRCHCGNLDLEKLECNGDLELTGLSVRASVRASGARVKGSIQFAPIVRLDRPTEPFKTNATISDTLDLTEATAGHLKIVKDTVSNIHIVMLDGNDEPRPRISLERGRFGNLEIESPTPLIDLAGVQVERWSLGNAPGRQRRKRSKWMVDNLETDAFFELQGTAAEAYLPALRMVRGKEAVKYVNILVHMHPFEHSTWVEVEKTLRNQSKDDDADQVYCTMRRIARLRRDSEMSWYAKVWDLLQDVLVRYGTRVYRPIGLWVPLFAICWFVFTHPANVELRHGAAKLVKVENGRVSGTDPYQGMRANVHAPGGNRQGADRAPHPDGLQRELIDIKRSQMAHPEDWTGADGFMLAMGYCLPIIDLPFHDQWSATQDPLYGKRRMLVSAELFALMATIFSYVLLSIFLLGVTSRMIRGKKE